MFYSKRLKITLVGKVAIMGCFILKDIRYGTPSNKFKTLMNSHPAQPEKNSPPLVSLENLSCSIMLVF